MCVLFFLVVFFFFSSNRLTGNLRRVNQIMYTQFLPFMTDTTSLAVDAAPAVSALAGLIAEGANLITGCKLRKMRFFPLAWQVGRPGE